jgi:hypothetical protein
LCVSARFDMTGSLVVEMAAVAGMDVEVSVVTGTGAKAEPAAVMISLWLIETEQRPLARRIGDIWVRRDS